jgi:hypothetical protein
VYSNKFVLSVLANGQVLKEKANGEVALPFDTEFQLRLRNKNSRRAVCRIEIDGEPVTQGGLIVPAHSYRDLDCSTITLKKFKFVCLQSVEAQDHGKDQTNADNLMGVISARWHLEKERPKPAVEHHHHHHYPYQPWVSPWRTYSNHLSDSATSGCESVGVTWDAHAGPKMNIATGVRGSSCGMMAASADMAVPLLAAAPDQPLQEGATVESGQSDMRFGKMNLDVEDNYVELRVFLKGYHVQAQDVASQGGSRFCDHCGAKAAKTSSKFCHACGNNLRG